MKRLLLLSLSSVALLMPRAVHAQEIRADVTRDNWVSAMKDESHGNNGGASQLKTKSYQELSLIDIDPKPLAGHVIQSVTLHLNCRTPQEPQRRLTVSSLSSDWVEGKGEAYKVIDGVTCYAAAEWNKRLWSFPGSDIASVINFEGNSLWAFADATPPDKDGWQTVAVDPKVVGARVAGISWGFALYDDVGSEWERKGDQIEYHQFPNRFFSSREQHNAAPYMTITLGAEDHDAPDAPAAVKSPASEALPSGEALVSWTTPLDHGPAGVIGFQVRYSDSGGFDWDKAIAVPQYLVPLAGQTGQTVTMHLRDLNLKSGQPITVGVRAVDAAGNLSPVTPLDVKTSDHAPTIPLAAAPAKPFDKLADNPTIDGVQIAVIDALDKVNSVGGQMIPQHPKEYLQANHLWSAADKLVRLYAAKNEFTPFQILLTGQTEGMKVELKFDQPQAGGAPTAKICRFRHVADNLPDPLIPSDGSVDIPAKDESINGQQSAALLADVYVPHDATPGVHTGTLTISHGQSSVAIKIELHVWDFTLADALSFVPEMGCYDLPANDLPWYRLAHENRCCLNRLGYHWSGVPTKGCGPKLEGDHFDWTEYDVHFGPLLDGSAFADLPRKSQPLDTFYLPLSENWPIKIDPHYKGGFWADQALDAPYWAEFTNAAKQMAEHFAAKKWTVPYLEFFLNGKVYYKRDKKSWDACSSLWSFDEPVNTQDFWALRQYGIAFHRGVDAVRGDTKMVFRCDISYAANERNILDGVCDVDCEGASFKPYNRLVMRREATDHRRVENYGGAADIHSPNVWTVGWSIDAWAHGADVIVPWQTIGNNASWQKGESTSVLYPPLANTKDADAGQPWSKDPMPSMRLKAFRQGQQDVEYLTMLGMITHEPRWVIANTAVQALNLKSQLEKTSEADAGRLGYGPLDPQALWTLRVQIGSMLDAAHPAAKTAYIDWTAPPRNMDALPAIGYINAK